MDYSRYEAEDFAANESYLRYYFKLDPVDVFFWQDWISKHPERLDVIMRADQLVRYAAVHLPEGEGRQQLENSHRTLAGAEPRALPPPAPTTHGRLTRLFAVAGILAAVLVGMAFMFHYSTRLSKAAAAGMQQKANNRITPLTILWKIAAGLRCSPAPGFPTRKSLPEIKEKYTWKETLFLKCVMIQAVLSMSVIISWWRMCRAAAFQ